jgi:CHAT domain-containing protein
MSENSSEQLLLRKYLLGELSDEGEIRRIEERLLGDDDFQEALASEEDELIDHYVFDELGPAESENFRQHFLCHPEREERLRLAQSLKVYATEHPRAARATPRRQIIQPRFVPWYRSIPAPLTIAAIGLIVIGVGFVIWKVVFRESEVDRGLVALSAAYRLERPIEARISQMNYAPYVVTRGPGDERVDQDQLRLAELTLLNALSKNPTPAVHYTLGKVYLAKKQFDQAIKEFDAALNGGAKSAQLYSDLGAAYLELGKFDLHKGPANAPSAGGGKGMEELAASMEDLTKALELNPNLLEALFNRALCNERLTLYAQAESDWQEYLKKDSTSQWAEEARRNLQELKGRGTKTSRSKEELLKDFLSAYESKTDGAAWPPLRLGRSRVGNFIVETLLDDYLKLAASGARDEAEKKLRQISYAGKLERENVADHYTADLARFYGSVSSNNWPTLLRARSLLQTANARYNSGEFDAALELYSQAKKSFAFAKDECEVLFAESWIGYCRLRTLAAQEGIGLFDQLSRRLEARRYLSLASQSFQALADAESSLNEFSKALELTDRALKLSEAIDDDSTTVHCFVQLVSMHLALSDYRQSVDFFILATTLARTLPYDSKLIWPAYYEVGLDFHFLDLPQTAFAFEQEALRLANDSEAALLRSRTWERLGLLYAEQKRYDEAIQSGERALSEAKNISSERARNNILAHAMLRLGRINSQAGNPQEALDYYSKSLALYQQLGSQLYAYEGLKGKLVSDLQLNHDDAADAELPQLIRVFEQNREKISEETNRDKFFDAGQNTYDLAIDFAYSRKKDSDQAFAYAEDSRARSLFEMMRVGLRLSKNPETSEIELGSGSKPLTLAEIQQRLPEKTQLLEYSVLDDKVLMWIITRSAIHTGQASITAAELEQRTRSYTGTISRPFQASRGSIIRQAKELYTTLIAPVEKYLDHNLLLIVIPDKSLNYLSFESLVSAGSGRYLIEDYIIERAPSATTFIELSAQATSRDYVANERLLSVGNPTFDPELGLPDLPAASHEAEEIARLYQPARLLIGEEATADRVKRALTEANVIHLATHAIADERSPLLSRLVMARDPRKKQTGKITSDALEAAQLYASKLPHTRLVVLSACDTGIERAYAGEGAIGFARPFMVAGVPIVIASLWPVDSEVTAEFMIDFHQHRKLDRDHVSTVEALRRAQLDMIQNQKPQFENYGWAAFTAIGGYASF